MKIYHNIDKYFSIYDTQNNHFEEIFDSLDNVTTLLHKNDVLLLPEEYFIFTTTHFTIYSKSPFSIQDLKSLQQKNIFKDKKNNNLIGQLTHHNINNLSVNDETEQFLLGKS